MIDASTKGKIYVSTDGTAGPYIMVPVSQLAEVRNILDENRIPYAVEENAISLDGEPLIAIIDLASSVDPKFVQDLLDRQP